MLKFEVADAQKALQMATRDDVRRAAQQLLNDHQDFDSHYIGAQIEAHQAAVTLFKREVDAGRDNDLSCDGCRS